MCGSRPFRSVIAVVLGFALAMNANEKQAAAEREPQFDIEDPGLRKAEPQYYLAIVGKPVKVERLDWERFGNLEPWHTATHADFDKRCMARCKPEGPACWKLCARERSFDTDDADNTDMPADDDDVIIVSNACGFMRTTYDHVLLANPYSEPFRFSKRRDFSIYDTIGEWCKLGNGVREEGEGLLLRKWGYAFYLIRDFTVLEGTADGYFIPSGEFRDDTFERIKPLLVEIEEEHQVCFDTDYLHPDELKRITTSGMFRRREGEEDDLCETHGLPISKVVSVYR